ncbi:hypothetical protein Avbf_15361 [Armadillidium vulgare]|nr:hypothetical protein Avbf_15361 [Armadillidium vulgare]
MNKYKSLTRTYGVEANSKTHLILLILENSYDHNDYMPASFFRILFSTIQKTNFVIYSKRTALTANSTTPSDTPDSRDSYDHNVTYSKRTALTANSRTPSDSPDSRDSYDHNDYMPSLIF